MYKISRPTPTTLERNESYIGDPLEVKVARIMQNKEPITDTAPLIYTERKDGVRPDYNVRTDRFDAAIDAMDSVSKSHQAKREERHKLKETEKGTETIPAGPVLPTQAQGT